ncbi:MAG: hypothetical protein OES46_14625 [Gammaproteobacteria bacterium]|nr:hypothetical protein [Gammaproteobacteria bacterium]
MKIFVVAAIVLISVTLSPSLLAADDENRWMKNNRRTIGVGVFYVEEDTELRISSDLLGAGTNVDFQDDLGLDEDDQAIRVAGHYRFKPRHRINFGFFDLSSDATATVSRNIQFDESVFPAGATVNSELGFSYVEILYTYSFFQNDAIDLGVSTGLNIYEFESTLEAPALAIKEEGDGTAPFPVFGVRALWNFGRKLGLGASLDYFEIDEGDVEGQVIDILVALDHQTWTNAGLGLRSLLEKRKSRT